MDHEDETQSGGVAVRRIEPGDWSAYREMSIEFVETCPTAILGNPTYMRAHAEGVWKDRAAACGSSVTEATFLALRNSLAVGFATVKLFGEQQRAHLTHLWVQPTQRRRGLGTTLLRQALQFAQDGGCRNVMLWVTEDNDAATGPYERHGFRPSGNNRYLRGDHGPVQVELELLL
jgi:ribosomal protein S18 acetylase RimI-like enzyme